MEYDSTKYLVSTLFQIKIILEWTILGKTWVMYKGNN